MRRVPEHNRLHLDRRADTHIPRWMPLLLSMVLLSGAPSGQPNSGGELFPGATTCPSGTAPARLPTIGSVNWDNGIVTITLTSPETDVYYIALLTTDLTISLDQAASDARKDKGRMIRAEVMPNGLTGNAIVINKLSPSAQNERFYVAVAAYRCGWNAVDEKGAPLRSGWRLHTESDGRPKSIAAVSPEKEQLHTQAYMVGTDEGIMYVRANLSNPLNSWMRLADIDNATDIFYHLDFGALQTRTGILVANSVLEAIRTGEGKQFDTLVIREGGFHHVFIRLSPVRAAQVIVKDNSGSERKGAVVFTNVPVHRNFVMGIAEYATLEGVTVDPVTEGQLDPAGISDEMLLLCAGTAHLSAAYAGIPRLEENDLGVTDGYLHIFDAIVTEWNEESSLGSRAKGVDRLAAILELIEEANTDEVMVPVTVKSTGVLDVDDGPDSTRTAYYDGYTRLAVDFYSKMEYLEDDSTGLAVLARISNTTELYSYSPAMPDKGMDFNLILDGYERGEELIRINSHLHQELAENGYWVKASRVTDEQEELIPAIAVELVPVALRPRVTNQTTMMALQRAPTRVRAPVSPADVYADIWNIVGVRVRPAGDSRNTFESIFASKANIRPFVSGILDIKVTSVGRDYAYDFDKMKYIISLPNQHWFVTYKQSRANTGIEYLGTVGESANLLSVTQIGNTLEIVPLDIVQPGKARVHIEEFVTKKIKDKSGKLVSKRFPLRVIVLPVVAFRLVVKGVNEGNRRIVRTGDIGASSVDMEFAAPAYMREHGMFILRRTPTLRVYNATVQVIPRASGGTWFQDNGFNNEGESFLTFDMSDPEQSENFLGHFGKRTLLFESASQEERLEIIYTCNGLQEEYLKEAVDIQNRQVDFTVSFQFSDNPLITDQFDLQERDEGGVDVYHVLGGLRVKLTADIDAGPVTNYTWSSTSADCKFYSGMGQNAKELQGADLSGPTLSTIYWEGAPRLGDRNVSLTASTQDGDISAHRTMRARAIHLSQQGDDVRMFQLWMNALGHSWSTNWYNGGTWGAKLGITGTFGSRELDALRRFSTYDGVKADFVTNEVLAQLEKHRKDFFLAVAAYPSDGRVDMRHTKYEAIAPDGWLLRAASELNSSVGSDATKIRDAVAARGQPNLFPDDETLKKQIIRMWTKKESEYQWGYEAKLPGQYFRIVLGGDNASIGFSQILNKWKYHVQQRVASLSPLNLYEPADCLRGFGVWANDPRGGAGFYAAFVTEVMKKTKNYATSSYPRMVVAGGTYADDYLELLLKGFVVYNSGKLNECSSAGNTWPELLRKYPKDYIAEEGFRGAMARALNYALIMRSYLSINAKNWTWQQDPAKCSDLTFSWGEQDWYSGVSLEEKLAQQKTSTLAVTVTGSGTVTPSGGCFLSGRTVTLTATPASGWSFSAWSGDLTGSANPATIVLNTNKAVTAVFMRN